MINTLVRRAFALVVFLNFAVSECDAADKWISLRSKNFFFAGNASESQMKRVARDLEEFREGFAMMFPGVGGRSSVGTTVVVFKDDASFKPYKPLYEGKPANISGYFQPGSDANYISLTADTETSQVIYHEFIHSLTRDSTSKLPPWASEGLAEFYSMFEVSGNGRDLILGRAIGRHVQTLKDHQLMPFPALLAVTHDSSEYNERTKQGIFYAESWALVHYLLTSADGQPKFTQYLKLLTSGKSIDDSFREAFHTDYATLEKEIYLYVRNRITWPAFRVKLSEKLDFDKEVQISPLTEAQSQYYLGDLLLHSNRYDAAEKELQKSIETDPHRALLTHPWGCCVFVRNNTRMP